jgi:hypothetical protein
VQYLIGTGTDGSGHQHSHSGSNLQGLWTLADILLDQNTLGTPVEKQYFSLQL